MFGCLRIGRDRRQPCAAQVLKQCEVPHRLHHVEDGEAALSFLYHHVPYDQAPRPDIVLLDLNLPGTNGLEVLREIRSDARLKRLPVIVLTTNVAVAAGVRLKGGYCPASV